MAENSNISQILATLAAQQASGTPNPLQSLPQPQSQAGPPPQYYGSVPQQYSNGYSPGFPPPSARPQAGTPLNSVPYPIPPPNSSGSIDLSNIRPVKSGSFGVDDVDSRSRGVPMGYRDSYNDMPSSGTFTRDNYRPSGRSYRNSRSRSRSPPRMTSDRFRDSYNPYRDERRDEIHRSFPPDLRDSPSSRYSPLSGRSIPGSGDFGPKAGGSGDDNNETMAVDASVVGLIIGRQGENMRRLEADTQTRIQFVTGPESSGPIRVCKITGSKSARENARSEIHRIIEENGKSVLPSTSGRAPPPPDRGLGIGSKTAGAQQPALRAGEDQTQIMVPNRTVGLIIGKGGETIRDLQARSGCHVNIVGEEMSINGLRPVNLIGTSQQASVAKELIMEIVETDARNLTNQTSNLPRDSRMPTALSGANAALIGSTGQANDKIQDSIVVPSEAVGMIIGKGGETIKNMQIETGCKINVSPAPQNGRDIERPIELVGSRPSIDRAKDAIMEKVHAVQGRHRANGSQQPQASQPAPQYQPPQSYGQPQAAGEPPGGEDAYAPYGGYQNYVALWYASNQAQQNQGPPGPQS